MKSINTIIKLLLFLFFLLRPTSWQQFTDFANVMKAFIGTSYLSLPFAFKQSGLAMIIKCKIMAVDIILESSHHYKELQNEECYLEMRQLREEVEQDMTLGDIGHIAIGKWGIRIVDLALILTQTGFCVAYFIFIGNTLKDIFPVKYPTNSTIANTVTDIALTTQSTNVNTGATLRNSTPLVPPIVGHETAPPFVLLLLVPFPFVVLMSFVRYVRKLGPISGIANVAILVGFVGLLAHILQGLHFNIDQVSQANWITFPIFFGQLTGAFEGIGCATVKVSNRKEVEDYQSRNYLSNSINESQEDANQSTETDSLVVHENDDSVEVPFVYKRKSHFLNFLFQRLTWKRNLIRTCLVTVTAALALLLKDEFAYVNALIGSMGSSVLAYILPCIFHLALFKNTNSGFVVVKNISLIVLGIVGGIVGVVMTVQIIVKDFTHKK
ncbi:hypothetical protein QZH41_010999 [Actinostola sp. cb2023]|nr:hypothetical protein QZH41_010999 [Actinostola sp. cb2023]